MKKLFVTNVAGAKAVEPLDLPVVNWTEPKPKPKPDFSAAGDEVPGGQAVEPLGLPEPFGRKGRA